MKENIGEISELELYDTIVLNGIIENVETHDENSHTVGVVVKQKVKRLNGEYLETIVDSFAFTKEMEDKCGWRDSYASIQMLTGSEPIDIDHIDETKIVSMLGEVDSKYYHAYSDYTGYIRCGLVNGSKYFHPSIAGGIIHNCTHIVNRFVVILKNIFQFATG